MKRKEEKGITLVALVVTIIVLLILAGVTIAMVLGQNGIFTKAETAREQTATSQEREQIRLAVLEAKTNSLTDKTSFLEELKKSIGSTFKNAVVEANEENTEYTITLENGASYKVDHAGQISKVEGVKPGIIVQEDTLYIDKDKQSAVILKGYKVSENTSEQTIQDGLVIKDEKENEFVWIPVQNPVYKEAITMTSADFNDDIKREAAIATMYTKIKASGETPMSVRINVTDLNETHYSSVYYQFSTTGIKPDKKTEAYEYVEPGVIHEEYDGSSEYLQMAGLSASTTYQEFKQLLQKEYDDMVKRVEKNKGFYIGRYETSLTADNQTAQSKKDEDPYITTEYNWYHLYGKQKILSTDTVTSHMVWGCQWYQMMIWMKDVPNKKSGLFILDTTDMGSFIGTTVYDNDGTTVIKQEGEEKILRTGITDYTKVKNIYDLAGNVKEWTMIKEETSDKGVRVTLGGGLVADPSGLDQSYSEHPSHNQLQDFGSRMTLY